MDLFDSLGAYYAPTAHWSVTACCKLQQPALHAFKTLHACGYFQTPIAFSYSYPIIEARCLLPGIWRWATSGRSSSSSRPRCSSATMTSSASACRDTRCGDQSLAPTPDCVPLPAIAQLPARSGTTLCLMRSRSSARHAHLQGHGSALLTDVHACGTYASG